MPTMKGLGEGFSFIHYVSDGLAGCGIFTAFFTRGVRW